MTEHPLAGRLGRALVIDVCTACQVFWFDGKESLQLTPAATLTLFELIGGHAAPVAGGATKAACPRCRALLRLTRDMQRTTRFEYWSCPKGDGRLTSFFNFLREKNFIRPLSAQELADLRAHVQTVNCSNCGAPVDLATGTACTHCGSPLSILDGRQAQRMVDQLRQADRARAGVDPALPLTLEHTRRSIHASFDAFERNRGWYDHAQSAGLVSASLGAITRWLRDQ